MITNFFYIIVGILGIITSFILSINHKSNRIVNFYFLIFLSLFSLKFTLEALFYFIDSLRPFYFYKSFFIITPPVIYLYFQNLIANTKNFHPKDLKHLLFPILFSCFILINNYFQIFGKFSSYFIYFTFCLVLLIYLVMLIVLLKNNIWDLKTNNKIVFNQIKKIKKWINFIFVIYLLLIIRFILPFFSYLNNSDFSFGENYSWISGCIFILMLIKIWTSPGLLFGYNSLYNIVKDDNFSKFTLNDVWIFTQHTDLKNIQDNALKENVYINLKKQINRIEKIALKDTWFRNNKYSKSELAEKLNIPKSHLNFIFKYHSKLSYAEFVNKARTFDAIELIESGYLSTHKMDSLALKVGYLSYNPFFLTFKDITGVSPMEYNKLKNNLK
jgi:AraC-like DNA-binding protein